MKRSVTASEQSEAQGSYRLVGDSEATLCHRGILRIDGQLPAMLHQPSITITPLGGRIWSADDGIYRTIFLEGDRGIVAFDTFHSPGAATAYRQAINRRFPGKPVHTVVYSHDHLDHTGYALDLAPAAEVIAHEECAEVVAARRSDGQRPATEVWSGERTEYAIDGNRFELVNPGPTHGNGNVAAYFPEDRILFMVDTVIPGVGYTFLPDWHLRNYVPTMRRLEDLGWETFVPGHFWPVGRGGFRENLDYVELLLEAGRVALAEGVDPDDYREVARHAIERYAGRLDHLFRFHEYFPLNLMRAMLHAQTGGWGLEDGLARNEQRDPKPSFTPAGPGSARVGSGVDRSDAPKETPAVNVQPVAGGLWSAACGDHRTVFAETRSGVVAFNSFGSAAAARAYRAAIERTLPGKPIRDVVLTIDHRDHCGFAGELAPGGDVIAHELTARALAGRDDGATLPTRIVRGDGEAMFDGVAVELVYPGPTVGTGNLAAYFPAQRALFLVGPRSDARYGLFADWHVEHYASSIRKLQKLRFGVGVPGRGESTDRAGIERAVDYFEGIQYATQKAYANGIPIWDLRAIEEYATELLQGSFGSLPGFFDHVGVGALRVAHHYLMGGWGLEDTQAPERILTAHDDQEER